MNFTSSSSSALARRVLLALRTLNELGFRSVSLYAWYKIGLRTGWLAHATRSAVNRAGLSVLSSFSFPIPDLPDRDRLRTTLTSDGLLALSSEASEISAGKVRLFGGPPQDLELSVPGKLKPWMAYESSGVLQGRDIKFTWEAGRLGWAYILARAYYASQDESYALTFWGFWEEFSKANPPDLGPHWASGQEVALRLVALAFAGWIFRLSIHSTPERMADLAHAIAQHASRIPPTLAYARAQNNNHLLSEALGLYTAASVLPQHPEARRWRALGWRWFNYALQTQFAADGSYVQHSTNYHRLALQAALWAAFLAASQGHEIPSGTLHRLATATHWLLALLDRTSGRVPNLGPNDGAYIQPLSTGTCHDYRPVLQAASLAFLGKPAFPPGPWDEAGLWLGLEAERTAIDPEESRKSFPASPLVLRDPSDRSWCYLRAARFSSRPGHADQLHADLWWRGLNLAQDPGTYLYNAPPPWDNALAHTAVHNTLTVDGREQMTRAGRFLYLDWAQAETLSSTAGAGGVILTTWHNGYRRLGLVHERSVTCEAGNWTFTDRLFASKKRPSVHAYTFTVRLHWLLPDWPWNVQFLGKGMELILRLTSPHGTISLQVAPQSSAIHSFYHQVVRAGELLHGSGEISPAWGWSSPNYGYKIPGVSLAVYLTGVGPFTFASRWLLPG